MHAQRFSGFHLWDTQCIHVHMYLGHRVHPAFTTCRPMLCEQTQCTDLIPGKARGPKDLRLCMYVCPSGHADVWFVTPHTSTFFVWFMWYGEGRCPLGTYGLGPLQSQLWAFWVNWDLSLSFQQVPFKSVGPSRLDLTKHLVRGLWAGSAFPWDTLRWFCVLPSSASFPGTESFSNGIVLSSDPMASAVTSVSPGCIYCQKDDYEIPNISNHQHYDRGSNTSQIYYSLSVTNI